MLSLLLMPAFGMAATSIQLQFSGHRGQTVTHKIILSPKKIDINGIAISSHIVPILIPELTLLLNPKNALGSSCEAGSYFHSVTKKTRVQKATGCLESSQAQKLYASLRKIESYRYLRRLP